MPVERFKKIKDVVADKVGDAKDAVADKVGDAVEAVNDRRRGGDEGGPDASDRAPESVSAPEPAAGEAPAVGAPPVPGAEPETPGVGAVDPGRAFLDAQVLRGPAGRYLYGDALGITDPSVQPPPRDPGMSVRQHLKVHKDWYRETHQRHQAQKALLDVAPPIRDLVLRQQIADAERATRDAIRAPYRSPEAWPVVTVRFAVSTDDQLGGVAAVLASSGLATRPDLVYGVSRVPDRLGGDSAVADRRSVVEWEIVHGCVEPLTPIGAPPGVVYLDGEETWVARAAGDSSVLDEDLALAFLTTAGIAPEQTLGIARFVTTDVHHEGDEATAIRGVVRGVSVFHRSQTARSATEQFLGLRWMMLPAGPPAGVHVEILNWNAVARVVHRQLHELPEIPSRFPYLPSTPQELIAAYLEIIGIWPGDCYSVQTTRDKPLIMTGFHQGSSVFQDSGRGPKLPCADGTDRRRLHGTTRVVIAYRDRPAYAEGRERWAAYQHQALSADLALEPGARRPVQDGLHPDVPGFLKGAAKVATQVSKVANIDDSLSFREGSDFPPHRYCWPPTTGL